MLIVNRLAKGCRMAWRGTVPCARRGESGRASRGGASLRIRAQPVLRGQAGACPSISRREKRTHLEEWMPKAWRGTVPCARHGESGRASRGGPSSRIRTSHVPRVRVRVAPRIAPGRPHRSGRADFPHPVLQTTDSLNQEFTLGYGVKAVEDSWLGQRQGPGQ